MCVRAESFINHHTILVSFFGTTSSYLHAALSQFYQKIFELAKIYDWERAVLPLVIDIHTYISTVHPSDPTVWVFPEVFQARFCNASTVLTAFISGSSFGTSPTLKRKREISDQGTKPARAPCGATNNSAVVCEAFNSVKGCNFPSCERYPQCKGLAPHIFRTMHRARM